MYMYAMCSIGRGGVYQEIIFPMFQIIFSVRLVFTESYNRIQFEYLREWLLVLEMRFLLKNVHS